jgi:LRR receptor-like serine/threonine-protein kinase FLS2
VILTIVLVILPEDSNKLQGTLPSEVCLLGSLENIAISGNMMHGELPSCLTSLPVLRKVDVDRNEFSSSLPPGFFLMPSLTNLTLSNNQFSGNLVALFEGGGNSFNTFQHLTTLQLHNNNFEGEVPLDLFFLSALDTLTLHGNDAITGRVDMLCDHHDLSLLTADCENVECACCTGCFY